jgi:hypothetical protein
MVFFEDSMIDNKKTEKLHSKKVLLFFVFYFLYYKHMNNVKFLVTIFHDFILKGFYMG